MGVYGNLWAAFPELQRRIVMTRPNGETYTVKAGVIADEAEGFVRRYAGGSYTELRNSDYFFVSAAQVRAKQVQLGDQFHHPNEPVMMMKLVRKLDFMFEGGFVCFIASRVQGANREQQEQLTISEGKFA